MKEPAESALMQINTRKCPFVWEAGLDDRGSSIFPSLVSQERCRLWWIKA